MVANLGVFVKQAAGYKAFVPWPFPQSVNLIPDHRLDRKHSEAVHVIGKLDGITQLLPDKDFFLYMFKRKDAASSSQIEGTQATIMDAIEAEAGIESKLPQDVDDILHYLKALNYGLDRIKSFPLSGRFICELHKELMIDARADSFAFPWEFRTSQNWIGGTSPNNARFVPPPAHEIPKAIGDLEKFLHENDDTPVLIKTGLIHAQFETIHPFADGNGRTWRLLVTMYLWHKGLLEMPVLYLSSFFKENQQLYYEFLDAYHSVPDWPNKWIDFFLDGLIETGNSAIVTSRRIVEIREEDSIKIRSLGKSVAQAASKVVMNLYQYPIVDVAMVAKWTWYSHQWAQNIVDKLVAIELLAPKDPEQRYAKKYAHTRYLDAFI